MGKTETIKQRSLYLYLPSIEQKIEWSKLADNDGTSISKWIVNNVEENLTQRSEKGKSRRALEQENNDLKEELASLQKRLKDISIIKENLEKDIRKYRAAPFSDSSTKSPRPYDRDLINLLRNAIGANKKHRYLTNDEILKRLNIEITDTEIVKGISTQLSRLEGYGLIKSTSKGWKWKDEFTK